MSLSRRDFLKYGGATATGVAVGAGVDLAPVQAAAVSLKIKEAKAFAGVCPYCAVGCGQLIYAKDGKIIDIEGNPDTPHTLGRLCPKGAATIQLSRSLDFLVIAEQVEDQAAFDVLRELGVDFIQGYAVERPHPLGRYH